MKTAEEIVAAVVAEAERVYSRNSSPLEQAHVRAALEEHFKELEKMRVASAKAEKLERVLVKICAYPYIPQGMVAMIEDELAT
jgi:hypothetical protein